MNLKNKKIFYKPWPYMVIEDFLKKDEINKIKNEILVNNDFDDKVMTNRRRINKGSTNFINLTKKSKAIKNIFNKLNSQKFYQEVSKIFDKKKLTWIPDENFSLYSKDFFGEQKFSFKEKITKILSFFNLIKTSLYLDIDFSVSEKGYYRAAHRDRDTRILNFLIYLNNFNKKNGGSLEIHKYKYSSNLQEKYPRFPKKKDTNMLKKIPPKSGRMVIFLSTPDSYHAAEKIFMGNSKRIFIYGSFSLNKKVSWRKNNFIK